VSSISVFVVAAFLEIAGCFAFWVWLRRGMSFGVALLGLGSLAGFAYALTRVESAFAGRAYAAYGGIYIACSLAWLRGIEGIHPDRWDVVGAGISVAGALVILLGRR